VEQGATVVGGGCAPGRQVPGPVVRLACRSPEQAARRLRAGQPPIIVRVADGALWVDLRAVPAESDDLLAGRLAAAGRP
jgi:L-seryl-tRNA(Ser) seleniumtransferase